ncbi:MAG: HNH endonuclease [Rhodospirillales bacterium]|nr:HNH endonuclease [Rhodospirillales bacterium]
MKFSEERRQAVFARTDGHCHICRRKLALKNYGLAGMRGAWEVEHSRPQANGGTHHLNNLYPACISCNRSKGKSSTTAARARNGYRRAPLSRPAREANTFAYGAVGLVVGRVLLAPLGPVAWIATGVIGAMIGKALEPE